MKNIINIAIKVVLIILCVYSTNTVAQEMDYFKGTWRNQTGNKVFTVTLWQDGPSVLKGHYKMITVNSSGQQTGVVYDSNKPIGTSTTNWPFVLSVNIHSGSYTIGGPIKDNTVTNQRRFIDGMFSMESISLICTTCVKKVRWKVKKDQGVRGIGEPDFNIPVNLELTKVE